MLRNGLIAVVFMLDAATNAQAQTTSHDPSTEFGQTNRLLGMSFWIIVAVIVAAALLFTFGSRRGRCGK
jgi:hypothetical protein